MRDHFSLGLPGGGGLWCGFVLSFLSGEGGG